MNKAGAISHHTNAHNALFIQSGSDCNDSTFLLVVMKSPMFIAGYLRLRMYKDVLWDITKNNDENTM